MLQHPVLPLKISRPYRGAWRIHHDNKCVAEIWHTAPHKPFVVKIYGVCWRAGVPVAPYGGASTTSVDSLQQAILLIGQVVEVFHYLETL